MGSEESGCCTCVCIGERSNKARASKKRTENDGFQPPCRTPPSRFVTVLSIPLATEPGVIRLVLYSETHLSSTWPCWCGVLRVLMMGVGRGRRLRNRGNRRRGASNQSPTPISFESRRNQGPSQLTPCRTPTLSEYDVGQTMAHFGFGWVVGPFGVLSELKTPSRVALTFAAPSRPTTRAGYVHPRPNASPGALCPPDLDRQPGRSQRCFPLGSKASTDKWTNRPGVSGRHPGPLLLCLTKKVGYASVVGASRQKGKKAADLFGTKHTMFARNSGISCRGTRRSFFILLRPFESCDPLGAPRGYASFEGPPPRSRRHRANAGAAARDACFSAAPTRGLHNFA